MSNPLEHTNPPIQDPLVQEATTWAKWNPSKDVQLSRTWAKLTEAQKETRKISNAANKIKRQALTDDITILNADSQEKIDALAEKYSYKSEYMARLVNTHGFKAQRNPSLHNAIWLSKTTRVSDRYFG